MVGVTKFLCVGGDFPNILTKRDRPHREDGHLLIDYLVLFAYNINYDAEKGRVYCFANPQCQYILDHYDEIIKPLRERGMKVIISVLGNHDMAGLAQLSDWGAREWAKEVAEACRVYKLDGVNLDDEYSAAPDLSNPWFTSHSGAAAARLAYELKVAMKELSETRIWLRLIGETGYVENAKLADLIGESRELSRILSASVATAKKKIRS